VLQQSALTLALLYTMPLDRSPYRGQAKIREWALAGLEFWSRIQHRDGSFDEYYPHEHGYIPTSFSLFAAAETCRVLQVSPPQVKRACLRAAAYLARSEERQALNQEAAAIPGMYAAYALWGEGWLKGATEAKLVRFLGRQSREGWFAEYGGADMGYLSTTLDFLMEYYRMSGDERAWEAAEKIVDFSQYFVHQDGSAGGQYGSRNTEYFLLSGLSAMAGRSPLARALLDRARAGTVQAGGLYEAFDDRYLCHNMLHALLRAVRNAPEEMSAPTRLPCDTQHERYFPEAGLLSVGRDGFHLVCGLKKGGVIRLFRGGREIFRDFGYRLKKEPGTTSATAWLNQGYRVQIGPAEYRISGRFTQVPQQPSTPGRHFCLRLAARLGGRRLIPLLKKRLIFPDRGGPARFSRCIRLVGQAIEIEDSLEVEDQQALLYAAGKFSLRHVASSKYFRPDELEGNEPREWRGVSRVKVWRKVDAITGQVETRTEAH
jgi:hypothetical protein